jgi:pimeloyl-ACP methyl ester carboxylesterase
MRIRLRSKDGFTSGTLVADERSRAAPLLVCIHGGGCNSGYFDIKGFSTVEAARRAGLSVLLVDRPGHAGNPLVEADRPIEAMAPIVRAFVDEVRGEHLDGSRDIVIIGHSIGGAVALTMAADRGDWPLRALAVSGIGDVPAPEVIQWCSSERAHEFPPAEAAASLFFGPEGTFGWQGPVALRRTSEPWRVGEVVDVALDWPRRWPAIAAGIDVPVHLRLAEHDRIWETGEGVAARMADRLTRSPRVDAALLAEGGHLYEIHKRGPELIASQLEFLVESVAAESAAPD